MSALKLQCVTFKSHAPRVMTNGRMSHEVLAKHCDVLELEDGWIHVVKGDIDRLIHGSSVVFVEAAKEQPASEVAPQKRRGRPPGSKNRKPDDTKATTASAGVQSD